jgi:hypothetical protein
VAQEVKGKIREEVKTTSNDILWCKSFSAGQCMGKQVIQHVAGKSREDHLTERGEEAERELTNGGKGNCQLPVR